MSYGQRGIEKSIKIAVDGEPLFGSFLKIPEFTVNPDDEIVIEDFLGEEISDHDTRHDGFRFTFSVRNEDEGPIELLDLLIARQRNHEAPPDITITVIETYRKATARSKVVVYREVALIEDEEGAGGRKEMVTTRYQARAKRRRTMNKPLI